MAVIGFDANVFTKSHLGRVDAGSGPSSFWGIHNVVFVKGYNIYSNTHILFLQSMSYSQSLHVLHLSYQM